MRCTYHTHRKTQPTIRTRRTTRLYTIYPCLPDVFIRTRIVQWSPLYHTYLHGTFVRCIRRYDLNIVTFLSIFVFIRTWYVRWYATSHAYLDGIFVHCACMYLPNHTTLQTTVVYIRTWNVRNKHHQMTVRTYEYVTNIDTNSNTRPLVRTNVRYDTYHTNPNPQTLVRTHGTLRHNIRPCECTVHQYLIPYYYPSYQSHCTLHTNVVHFLNPLVHTNVVHL